MKEEWFKLEQYDVSYKVYRPRELPLDGAVQIVHNISEHGGRYEEVAEFLSDYGYEVYVMDLPGHGSAKDLAIPGDAVTFLLAAIFRLQEVIRQERGSLPLTLLGHGLGGLLALGAQENYHAWDALVLSSPNRGGFSKGEEILMALTKKNQSKNSSPLKQLAYALIAHDKNLNLRSHAWRSRDVREWMNYDKDPLCGLRPSQAMSYSLSKAKTSFYEDRQLKRLPKNLPCLLLAGTQDPVGHKGKDALNLAKRLTKEGLTQVYLRLYEEARYDLFWDDDRQGVFNDILQFLRKVL